MIICRCQRAFEPGSSTGAQYGLCAECWRTTSAREWFGHMEEKKCWTCGLAHEGGQHDCIRSLKAEVLRLNQNTHVHWAATLALVLVAVCAIAWGVIR